MRIPVLTLAAFGCLSPAFAQARKAPPAKAVLAPEPKLQWDGEWTLVPDQSDQLEALLEAHLKEQNFALKAYWKKKLQKACRQPQAMDILCSGAEFSVTFDRESPVECSPDGTASTWKRSDGQEFQVTLRRDGPRMAQTFRGDGYSLAHVYTLSRDSNTLALEIPS